MRPYNLVKVNRRCRGTFLCLYGQRNAKHESGSKHRLTMKIIGLSETSVDFQQVTRNYIPEGKTLHSYCEVLKCYTIFLFEGATSRLIFSHVRETSD
jgi:hypothetical protein